MLFMALLPSPASADPADIISAFATLDPTANFADTKTIYLCASTAANPYQGRTRWDVAIRNKTNPVSPYYRIYFYSGDGQSSNSQIWPWNATGYEALTNGNSKTILYDLDGMSKDIVRHNYWFPGLYTWDLYVYTTSYDISLGVTVDSSSKRHFQGNVLVQDCGDQDASDGAAIKSWHVADSNETDTTTTIDLTGFQKPQDRVYRVNWGDGTYTEYTVKAGTSQYTKRLTHTYPTWTPVDEEWAFSVLVVSGGSDLSKARSTPLVQYWASNTAGLPC